MTAFALNQADLAFILRQIKIAEAHAKAPPSRKFPECRREVITDPSQYHPETGAFLGDPALQRLIPDPHVPNGLRTVDGTYNNLTVPGREKWGASGEPMPRLFDPTIQRRRRDGPNETDGDHSLRNRSLSPSSTTTITA